MTCNSSSSSSSTCSLGFPPSIALESFVSAAILLAQASYSYSSCIGQHSAKSDLISEDVDEDTERFMTLPQRIDRKRSPFPQKRRTVSPSRKLIPADSLVHSRGASPSSIHKDGTDCLQMGFLGLSSSEQEALIREQERIFPFTGVPRTQSYYVDCQAGRRIEHYPRKRVTVHHKQDTTYASLVANGNAAIFWCAACEKCLFAAEDIELLYCSECGTLTPTGDIKGN